MGAEEWCFGLIASTMFLQYNVYGHITLNTPVLVRSLKLSKVKSALTNRRITAPNLYGPPKDHKVLEPGQENLGPPNRPVCGAREAPNAQLSMLASEVLKAAVEAEKLEIKTESKSTEDILAAMDTFNKEREQESEEQRTHKVVLGSMDVAALYPSLDSKEDAHTAGQLVRKHSCLMTSFCWLEGARFLALSLKPAEIQQLGLQHVVHTRKHQGGAALGLTTLETATPLHHTILEQSSKLNPPEALASEEEKKDILAAVVSKAIQIAMSEHVYHFNGTVYRQEKGGPMGNTLSGELARSTMLRWDQALLDILKKHTIIDNKMYKRYVDDQLGAYRELQPGVRWNQETNSLDIDENQVEPDKLLPGDQRTMAIVRQLANTINKRIVMVEDFPSKHQGGKMPVLDLQCWVEENGYLRWEHYSKPMSNPLLPLNISALPARMRRTTQIQEGMKIMRNWHQDLDWSIVAEHLSELMKRLQMSGYPPRYRESILKSVLAGHETKRARAAAPGGRPLHRSDEYHRDERAKIKARQGKL